MNSLRILAIDFSAIFRRNWEATGGKELSEAYSRTLRTVAEIRQGFDRVALLCDSGQSFRKALLPTYKADREKPPAPYYEQMSRTAARLMADGCIAFSAPLLDQYSPTCATLTPENTYYAEADDLCASLAEWCMHEGHALVIYGGDKDLLQCLTPEQSAASEFFGTLAGSVRVARPDHAGLWDAARVAADPKIGVEPRRIPDWLALGGDRVDGFKMFPGWEEPCAECNGNAGNASCKVCKGAGAVKKPGIGPGNAAKLLARFGSIMGVVDAAMSDPLAEGEAPAFPPSHQRDVIRRAQPSPREAAALGLRLATLVKDLSVDWSCLLEEPVVSSIAEESKPMAPHPDEVSATEIVDEATSALVHRTNSAGLSRFGEQYKSAQAMMDLAERFYDARMFGSFPNAQAIFTVMWLAAERSENVGHALVNSYVIKAGKPPGYLATYLAARVKTSPVCKEFKIVETTADHATVKYQRVEDPEPEYYRFDLKEAEAAGWLKEDGPWVKRPRAMLRAAALREAARAFFYDVVSGMDDADEYVG